MPNLRYPKNIYLQGNLRLTEKRTVRDDARINNRGDGRTPGPTQRPNNSIPLKEWFQEQLDNNEFDLPCSCEQDPCFLDAYDDIFKFSNNGLSYQFLDIVSNDYMINSLTDLEIVIVDDDGLSGDRTVTVYSSPFYHYPIIKLTKPSDETELNNIDEPEEFTYKLTGTCNGEVIESNIATVTILPTSVNLEMYINETGSVWQ